MCNPSPEPVRSGERSFMASTRDPGGTAPETTDASAEHTGAAALRGQPDVDIAPETTREGGKRKPKTLPGGSSFRDRMGLRPRTLISGPIEAPEIPERT